MRPRGLVAASVAAAALCGAPSAAAAAAPRPYALLGDGTVVVVRGAEVRRVATLAPGPLRGLGSGPLLAAARGAVFAGGGGRVIRVPAGGRGARVVHRLRDGLTLRALVAGPRTGAPYVVASASSGALVVQRVAAAGGVPAEREVKAAAGHVHGAAVDADERTLAVAYHGSGEGFDLVDLETLALACPSPSPGGCERGHGSVHFAGGRLFTSTGRSAVGELLSPGRVRVRPVPLPGNHMLELASDPRALYVLGACGYGGGLARVDLAGGPARVLTRDVCGTRVVVGPGGTVLVARNRHAVPQPAAPARLVVLDRRSGAVRRTVRVPAAILDVAVG